MTIRTYVDSDCAAGLGIFDSNVPEYFASAERAEFARFLQAPDADFFVVERDGSVVGCGGCYVRDSIGRLCWGMIHNVWHRSSLGSALLALRLDRLFFVLGATHAKLDTNQLSSSFFARFGFAIENVEQNGFAPGIDCVSMSPTRDDWLHRVAVNQP